jgi:hypothetical protein
MAIMDSVSNGSGFGPGWFYRSAWHRRYPIKNRRLFKRAITLMPQILIRAFSVWYVKYAARAAHLLAISDFRYLQISASGSPKTSFSGQKWQ